MTKRKPTVIKRMLMAYKYADPMSVASPMGHHIASACNERNPDFPNPDRDTEIERGILAAMQVYEEARWKPISELPKDAPFIGPISGGPLYLSIINDEGEEVFCVITDGEGR